MESVHGPEWYLPPFPSTLPSPPRYPEYPPLLSPLLSSPLPSTHYPPLSPPLPSSLPSTLPSPLSFAPTSPLLTFTLPSTLMIEFFLPTSRALLPTFHTNCPDGSHFAQMGPHFVQNTTTNPCSLLSRHKHLVGICTYVKHPQPHPKTPLFLA